MQWTAAQLDDYHRQGFLLHRGLLDDREMSDLHAAAEELLTGECDQDGMHREREFSGAVRQVYLAHRHQRAFKALARNPKILQPVRQLIGEDVYIWHSKLNAKAAFEGMVWLWHQDYGYWYHDGVEPRMMSVLVLLDKATPNNGCLMVVPGSHRWGRVDHHADTTTTSYKQWCITREVLQERLREEDIRPITGEPGDVLFFDCNLVHGSNHNMSPLPRKTFIIAYNAMSNQPQEVENPRPDWVVAREFEAVV